MKTIPHKTSIRRYLVAGGKLTQMAALNFWGCMRLSSRIDEIKKDYENDLWDGSFIDKTMVKTSTGKWVAEYFLVKDD